MSRVVSALLWEAATLVVVALVLGCLYGKTPGYESKLPCIKDTASQHSYVCHQKLHALSESCLCCRAYWICGVSHLCSAVRLGSTASRQQLYKPQFLRGCQSHTL